MIEQVLKAFQESASMHVDQQRIYVDMHTIKLTSKESISSIIELYLYMNSSALSTPRTMPDLTAFAVREIQKGINIKNIMRKLADPEFDIFPPDEDG